MARPAGIVSGPVVQTTEYVARLPESKRDAVCRWQLRSVSREQLGFGLGCPMDLVDHAIRVVHSLDQRQSARIDRLSGDDKSHAERVQRRDGFGVWKMAEGLGQGLEVTRAAARCSR